MDYLVYFVGPFLLAFVGVRLMRQRAAIFGVGLLTFFIVWVLMQTLGSVVPATFGLGEKTFGYAIFVSALAAVCEEPARYFVFRRLSVFHQNRTWSASLAYAFGHHGMETIIVGLNVLLVVFVVRYRPDLISDPDTLRNCQEAAALGLGMKLYNAFERLLVGLLIHACFSAVVMLAASSGRTRWLALAMTWHFAHNLIGFTLQRLPSAELLGKLWIGLIIVGYSYLLVSLYRALKRLAPPGVRSSPLSSSHPPLILPGRST